MQNQKNVKDVTSEELGLFIAEQYEQINVCKNNMLIAHAELQRRLAEKKSLPVDESIPENGQRRDGNSG